MQLLLLPFLWKTFTIADFVIGTAIGEGSGDHLGPQRVQAKGAKPPEAPAFKLFSIARNAFKFCDFDLTANSLKSYLPG